MVSPLRKRSLLFCLAVCSILVWVLPGVNSGEGPDRDASEDPLKALEKEVADALGKPDRVKAMRQRLRAFLDTADGKKSAERVLQLLLRLPPVGKAPVAPKFPFDRATAARYQKDFAEQLGLPQSVTNAIGMEFVLVPPGTFRMGSPKDEPGHGAGGHDETLHKVTLTRPFYLGKHEVTVGQFRQFVTATKYRTDGEKTGGGHAHDELAIWKHRPGTHWLKPGYAAAFDLKETHPVVHVSHADSTAFCRWLAEKTGLARGKGMTCMLPTEAQWEWACRAGSAARYWWGSEEDTTGKVANVGDRTLKRVHPKWPRVVMPMDDGFPFPAPVGSYRANGFGLHDMIGNVWEFCSTRCGPYPLTPVTDPGDGDPKRGFAVRGGGWSNQPADVRCGVRNADPPHFCHSNLGFRVALTFP